MGLFLLLTVSCENDEASEVGSGKMIEVHVNIPGLRAGGSEEALRSAPVSPLTGRRTIAMTSQSLGNGMLLDMSLEPNEVSELRATPIALEAGKTFRVIALNSSTKRYVSHADFTITDGVDSRSESLYVPEGVSHDFICFSHNDNSVADGLFATTTYNRTKEPADIAVPLDDRDLLYANVLGKTFNSAAEATLSFMLEHKLSRVRLEVDGNYNQWPISSIGTGIYVKPFYAVAKMRLRDGNMTKNSASTTQGFTDWTVTDTYAQTSAPRTVFTNGEEMTLVVPAHSITINGNAQPSVAKTISFPTVSSLVAGHDYTLHMRIRIPRWAGSNIYWDEITDPENPKLTFDPEGSTENQGYQGVYFRFGSLVGISPAQPFRTNDPVYSPTDLYVPYGYPSNPRWKATNVLAVKDDPDIPAATDNYTTFTILSPSDPLTSAPSTDIPYLDASYPATNYGKNSTFVMDEERNTKEMYEGLRGDICQYLGKTGAASTGYRLPAASEMSTGSLWDSSNPETVPVGGGWVRSVTWGSANTSTNDGYPNGRADLLSEEKSKNFDPDKHTNPAGKKFGSIKNIMMGNVILPASYPLFFSGYKLNNAGSAFYYWSGSAQSDYYGHYLCPRDYQVAIESRDKCYAIVIRCVKN
jgi:hypothetical protein